MYLHESTPAVFCLLIFVSFSPASCIPQFVNPVDKQSFNTPVTLQHLSWECFTFYACDLCTLGPVLTWLHLFAVAGRQFGRVTMMAWSTIEFICVRQDMVRKACEGHKSGETVKWEWGHFPCKEIKVKRKIKVWFPASWFAFYTAIPFFLSDFAETTIAPLPVLVTVTPPTLSLGGCVLLHLP